MFYLITSVNIQYDEKKIPPENLFKSLLCLPILLHNIINTLKAVKGMDVCPKIVNLNICILVEKAKTKFWYFKYGSDNSLKFYLNALLINECDIPNENSLIQALLELSVKDLNLAIKEAITLAKFIPISTLSNKPIFLNPLINKEGNYRIGFRIFDKMSECEVELDNEDLEAHLSACIMPVKEYSPAVKLKINLADDKFILELNVPDLNGPNKLLIRFGNNILCSMILFCYNDPNMPDLLRNINHG